MVPDVGELMVSLRQPVKRNGCAGDCHPIELPFQNSIAGIGAEEGVEIDRCAYIVAISRLNGCAVERKGLGELINFDIVLVFAAVDVAHGYLIIVGSGRRIDDNFTIGIGQSGAGCGIDPFAIIQRIRTGIIDI